MVFSGISQLGRTAVPAGTRQLPKCRLIIAVCAYPLSRDLFYNSPTLSSYHKKAVITVPKAV
nr:MAG TPA: hypothetical protein [Caudoviricetes sp.]